MNKLGQDSLRVLLPLHNSRFNDRPRDLTPSSSVLLVAVGVLRIDGGRAAKIAQFRMNFAAQMEPRRDDRDSITRAPDNELLEDAGGRKEYGTTN